MSRRDAPAASATRGLGAGQAGRARAEREVEVQPRIAQVGQAQLRITAGMLHGALLQLVTGLALVGVREADDLPVDHAKIGVKTVVLIAILAVILLNRGKERVSTGPWLAVGLLTTLNIGLAVFWT